MSRRGGESSRATWEQLNQETARSFAAFAVYRDLDPSVRTIKAACEVTHGVDAPRSRVRTWQQWAARHEWGARAKAWDAELDRRRRDSILDAVEDMRLCHVEAARALLAVARESIRRHEVRMKQDPDYVFPPNLHAGMLREAAALERASRGTPAQIDDVAPEIQEVIVRWGDEESGGLDEDAVGDAADSSADIR